MADSAERKAALIAQLDAQRRQLARQAAGVRASADVSARLQGHFARHRLKWLGGAFFVGLLAMRGRRHRRTTESDPGGNGLKSAGRAGFWIAAAKIAFDLAKPALLSWASSKASDYLERSGPADPVRRP